MAAVVSCMVSVHGPYSAVVDYLFQSPDQFPVQIGRVLAQVHLQFKGRKMIVSCDEIYL